MRKICFIFALTMLIGVRILAQGYVRADYLTTSSITDKDGEKYGRSDLMKFTGRYTVPLSVKKNANGNPIAWSATLGTAFAIFGNKGGAEAICPDRVLNASLNISHTRPLSDRWKLIATLGAGVYAAPNDIAARSILANGAVIFAYRFSDNLNIGIGGGLTNAYGVPMIMPMGYLSWNTNGRFRLAVDMASGLRVVGSTSLSKRFRIELAAIEMEGMSAVRRIDGKSKIYSTMTMSSILMPVLQLSDKTSAFIGVGGSWLHTVSISDRSLKGFFKQFGSDENKYRFHPSMRFTLGFRYGF